MKRTAAKQRKIQRKPLAPDPYLGEVIRLVRHWNSRSSSNYIPANKVLKVRKAPPGEQNNFLGVWVKYKGRKMKLLLAEVVFIRDFIKRKKVKQSIKRTR